MTTNQLRFTDFLSAAQKEQQSTIENDVQDEVIQDESQETSSEVSDELNESAEEGMEAPSDQETQGQEPQSPAAVRFEDLLREKGIPVDDEANPAELYESVISRALAGSKAMAELTRLKEELEALKSRPAEQAAPQQQAQQETQSEPASVAQEIARRFRELQKYDPLLENYVERDDNGYVKPIASFGQVSIDAARTINEFERASREQADLLLRNPLAVVEDSRDIIAKIAEERANSIVEAKLNELRAQEEEKIQSYTQQQQQQAHQQQLMSWHDQNKATLFHLDPNGEPKQDFFGSGDVAWTKTGMAFKEKLGQLRSQLPDAPEITLRQLALDFATAVSPASNAAVQQQAPTAEPVVTQAEQRRRLADSRQPVPNQNTPAADVGQIAKSMPTLRLADMVRMNPDNAERVSGWR